MDLCFVKAAVLLLWVATCSKVWVLASAAAKLTS